MQTLPLVVAQADANTEVIVVDYACPDGTAEWVNAHFPDVKVIRVTDDVGFNISRARNFGAANTQAKWLAFFDADIILNADFFVTVIPSLKTGFFYLANDNDLNKFGSCIVARNNFEAIGGYDEAIEGYGGEDNDLYEMLGLNGIARSFYAGDGISPIRHTHKNRTTFYQDKNIWRSMAINQLYRIIKSDIIRHTKQHPNLIERKHLRKQVIQKLAQPTEKNQNGKSVLSILLPERQLKTPLNSQKGEDKKIPPKVKAYLSYEIDHN